jgi:hypothetical protein
MKYLARYISLWIALSAGSLTAMTSHPTGSQAGEDPMTLARKGDSLLARQEWFTASILFRKAAWLAGGGESAAAYALRAAQSLAAGSQFKDAAALLRETPVEGLADSSVFNLRYHSALYAFMDRDFAFADNALMQADYLIADSMITSRGWLLHALILNEQLRWDEANFYVQRLNNLVYANDADVRLKLANNLNQSYSVKARPRLKSQSKARRMSTFVPGLGQVYAGFPGEGITVFVTVTAIAGAALVGILNQYYFTSIVLGNYVFGKFYLGGLARTEFLVDKSNYLRTHPYNKQLREFILSAFPGVK